MRKKSHMFRHLPDTLQSPISCDITYHNELRTGHNYKPSHQPALGFWEGKQTWSQALSYINQINRTISSQHPRSPHCGWWVTTAVMDSSTQFDGQKWMTADHIKELQLHDVNQPQETALLNEWGNFCVLHLPVVFCWEGYPPHTATHDTRTWIVSVHSTKYTISGGKISTRQQKNARIVPKVRVFRYVSKKKNQPEEKCVREELNVNLPGFLTFIFAKK